MLFNTQHSRSHLRVPSSATHRLKAAWGHRLESKVLVIALILIGAFASSAHAQVCVAADRETAREAAWLGLLTTPVHAPKVAPPRLQVPSQPPAPSWASPTAEAVKRPALLPAMYVSLGALQGLDLYTTTKGLSAGAREANPVMAGLVSSPAKAAAFKAATTAGTIYFAEKLWKKNPVAAIALVAAVNGVTAAVVVHNIRVARIAAGQ
jgi:hypothetical protein